MPCGRVIGCIQTLMESVTWKKSFGIITKENWYNNPNKADTCLSISNDFIMNYLWVYTLKESGVRERGRGQQTQHVHARTGILIHCLHIFRENRHKLTHGKSGMEAYQGGVVTGSVGIVIILLCVTNIIQHTCKQPSWLESLKFVRSHTFYF